MTYMHQYYYKRNCIMRNIIIKVDFLPASYKAFIQLRSQRNFFIHDDLDYGVSCLDFMLTCNK